MSESDSEKIAAIYKEVKKISTMVAPSEQEKQEIVEKVYKIILESGKEGVEHHDLQYEHNLNRLDVSSAIGYLSNKERIFQYRNDKNRFLWKAHPMEEETVREDVFSEQDGELNTKSLSLPEYSVYLTIKLAFLESRKIITRDITDLVPITKPAVYTALKSLKELGVVKVEKEGSSSVWTINDGFINEE